MVESVSISVGTIQAEGNAALLAGPVHMRSSCPPRGLPLSGRRWISGQKRFQGAGNAQAFSMQITHGGFQRGMSHRFLNGARVGTAFQTVSGITMAEFVREDRDAEFAAGQFDGALDIGFVHAVADLDPCARMETGVMSGKKPGPRPGELIIRIFSCQLKRKHERDAILFIPLPDGAGKFDLLGQIRNEGWGQGNDPILTALGADDEE